MATGTRHSKRFLQPPEWPGPDDPQSNWPAPSVGNTAQAIGSPDADPVVDHQGPQFVVYGDVHLDPAGISVTSGTP